MLPDRSGIIRADEGRCRGQDREQGEEDGSFNRRNYKLSSTKSVTWRDNAPRQTISGE